MVPEQATKADKQAILADLEYMTARWHELPEEAALEVRLLAEDKKPLVLRYDPSALDMAADDIASWTGKGRNAYVIRNPIRKTAPASGATDEDVIASFFLWADCDDSRAADNVRKFTGPQYSAAIVTGTVPETRVHIYWQLDRPCYDMEKWRAMQVAISRHLQSDEVVVNPSRIMRIGGTITHPAQNKRNRGYVSELTTLRTEYPDPRQPVSLDQMARVFGSAPAADNLLGHTAGATSHFDIDLGTTGNSVEQYLDIIRRAGTDGEKHGGVRDLTAKMARAGVPRNMTEAMVRSVCPVWDANVDNLIQTAYENFRVAEQQQHITPQPDRPPFESWKPIDPATLPPRDFIYGRHYIRKFAALTVAPGGLGKSTLVLAECIAIATGRTILGIKPKRRERVVYFNAEDPKDEIDRRVLAMVQHFDIPQTELVDWLYTSSGRDQELILATGDEGNIVEPVFSYIEDWSRAVSPGVFAFDPLANMTESPETNDVFRRLGKRLSRMADELNCAIEIVHHTRKLNGREAEVEDSRGGGALIGAVRSGRVLNPMTADEAAKAQLESHIDYFRIEAAGKNNLARPSAHAEWFRRVSIELPNGDSVAAVEVWKWPDAFDGITAEMAAECQSKIIGLEEPPRAHWQARNWVGFVLGDVLNIDVSDKAGRARVNAIQKTWIEQDVLRIEQHLSKRDGREVPVVVVGNNNMREVT